MTLAQTYTAFTPEVWSPRVQLFFKMRLKAATFFDDYSSEVAMGGDTIHIPKISLNAAAAAIPATSGAITSTDLSDTNATMTISSWMGVKYTLSDLQYAQVMKSMAVKERYAQAIGEGLARQLDTAILANGSSITAGVGNSATNVLATSLQKAMGIVQSNSVPTSECIWIFHPKTYFNEVLKNQQFYDASQFGKVVLPTGISDMLLGVPVVLSENVPVGTAGTEGASGHRNLLVHKRAIAFATGALPGAGPGGVRISEKGDASLATYLIGDIAYGTVVVDAKAGCRVISKT